MGANELLIEIQKKKAQRDLLQSQRNEASRTEEAAQGTYEAAVQAREVVKAVAIETQRALEFKFSSIVTTALAAVLDEPYEFVTEFVERRNKMECDLLLTRDGAVYGITDTVGGGCADLVSFALRIAYWSLAKNRPTFILDEPFRNLSVNYHEKASAMLKMLSDKLGIQFIMVSHQPEMIGSADRVFTIANGQLKGGTHG